MIENAIIYKVENTKNGKVYIGATTKELEERKSDHIQKAKNDSGSYFQEAISTFGPEFFEWKQIDTANNIDELAEKERKYIIKYNSRDNGYNSDSGGGFKKTVYQYNINTGKCIANYESLEEASKAVSSHKNCIANTCLGQSKSCKGYYWSYNAEFDSIKSVDLRKKKVLQLDLNGEFINEFVSVADASRANGFSRTCISRCCRGERKQSSGYLWKYS